MKKCVCVRTDDLLSDGNYLCGFNRNIPISLYSSTHLLLNRDDVEDDPKYKQIIPYTCISNQSRGHILAYKRSTKGGEDRLHQKWSIGFGGHMERISRGILPTYQEEASRELSEECNIIADPRTIDITGCINDDRDSVGRVHFGITMIAYVPRLDNLQFNHEVAETRVLTNIPDDLDQFETWSQFYLCWLLGQW